MSYRLNVLSELPVAYWRLEETTGTVASNSTGLGFDGTIFGTPLLGSRGLVSESLAIVFSDAQHVTANLPNILLDGNEALSCCIELWAKTFAVPTARRLLAGRLSAGVFITPTGFEFSATSSNGTTYVSYYTVTDWNNSFHITANYVGYNLSLIVNNQEGTNADFLGKFTSTTDSFYFGGTSTASSTTVMVDEVAVYRKTLPITLATKHYDAGTISSSPDEASRNNNGIYYSMSDISSDVSFTYEEYDQESFDAGFYSDVEYRGGALQSTEVAGNHTSDLEFIGNLVTVGGSRIDWDASTSVVVETSLNKGVTWDVCQNHKEIPGLAPGTNVSNKFIKVRKTFMATSGTASRLDRLKIVTYKDKVMLANAPAQGMTIYGNVEFAETNSPPSYNKNIMGTTFTTGAFVTAPALTDGVRAMSFWLKRNAEASTTAWEYIYDTRTGGTSYFGISPTNVIQAVDTMYINGVGKTVTIADLPLRQWVHVTAVFAAQQPGAITFNARYSANEGGLSSFAHISLFTTNITARQALINYKMSVGAVTYQTSNGTVSSVIELPSGTKVYNNHWITGQIAVT